ncbi:MAG: 30S ribosomal protein S16 [Actinomycetes bacterium]
MAVKIKLMRMGKIRAPYYRIVVADSRTKRDGRAIETIGKYHPMKDPSLMEVDAERVAYWLSVGAQPTEPVAAILRRTGDWQRFAGEPAPPPLLVAAAPVDRKAVFEGAARQAQDEPKEASTAPRGSRRKPADGPTDTYADTPVGTPADAPALAGQPAAAAGSEA